jgi:hypothetical protein
VTVNGIGACDAAQGTLRSILSLLSLALLAACMQTTALEPQNKPFDSSQARLHFIRQPAILTKIGNADIRIDGKPIGSLTSGTYIVADRQPGPHKISVHGLLDEAGFEAEVNFRPGTSYYFELGPIIRINMDAFTHAAMGVTGQPVPGRPGPNSYFMFYSLDPATGAASVAKLGARS